MGRWFLAALVLGAASPLFIQPPRADATEKAVIAAANPGLELGFPESWTGDSYRNVSCRVSEIPEWLDGYFVALVNGAYGRQSDMAGSKLTHMSDGLAALASVQFKHGMVRFSGKYLPTRAYKIWDFYGRDMSHSRVAWATLRSSHMAKAKEKWDQVTADYLPYNPNMNLWKVGASRVIAVAENPEIGLQFDVASLGDFRKADLHDTNDLFTGRSSVKLVNMAAHSRAEPDGAIYGTVSGVEPSTKRTYQFVFRISPKGVRTLEGAFEYGKHDPSKCGSDRRYIGDKRVLAGLVKSVASTNQYLIIPITSAIVNPCKYQTRVRKYYPRHSSSNQWDPIVVGNYSESEVAQDFTTAIEFGADVPVRFLIFNKRTRQFVTNRPLDSYPPRFISHQLNAYEIDDNRITVDMITYDNYETYDRSLYVDYVLRDSTQHPMRTRPVRFTLDIQRGYIERTHLVPETVQAPMEYPSINPNYNGRRYRYAYVVQPPFTLGSQLGKIDAEDHSGARNIYFSHGPSAVLGEPTFVPRPNAKGEDDGVLLSMGLEMLSQRSVLYIVDAKTMKEVGRAEMPVVVPFGFHARYFDRQELMDSPLSQQASTDQSQPPESIDSILSKIYPGLVAPWAPTKEGGSEKSELEKQDQFPIVVGQYSNTEPDSKPAASTTSAPEPTSRTAPVIETSAMPKSTTAPFSFATWLSGGTSSTTPPPTPEDVKDASTPAATAKVTALSNAVPGIKGFYLNNGTFLELFPDGSMKSYPPIPNYFRSFYPTPAAMPVTVYPPYLGVDPAFVQFVKSQIPAPLPFTTPVPFVTATPVRLEFPAPPPNFVSAPYPRFIFPGHDGAKATTTSTSAMPRFPKILPESSRTSNKSAHIVVDVVVDPSKRTRRPQPVSPVADDPVAANTTEPVSRPRPPKLSSTQSTAAAATTTTEVATVASVAATSTASSQSDHTHDQTRHVESASAANDSIGRFFERGRGFLCNFFGKAITALGSNFCKMEAKGKRKSKRVKDGK